MRRASALRLGALAIAIAAATGGGYVAGKHGRPAHEDRLAASAPGAADSAAHPGKVLYWHDPMVPGQRFDKPGKSPFMDMQLVPVYAADAGADAGVKVSPTLQQNLGMRFATVQRDDTSSAIDVVGTTQFDESAAEVVQSRVTGYIDHLYARAPMQRIRRGAPIASVFVPEWLAPQEEYLALKRDGNAALAAAARQRMHALSIPEDVITQADRTGRAQNHFTLRSPVTGVVSELLVRDGAMVTPGVTIAKVAGLAKVWLIAEIPESLAASTRPGMAVAATFSGNAQRQYSGKIREILPGVSSATRTVQARLELDNQDGSLMPGMLMRIRLSSAQPSSRLLVPSEAVITTGRRAVVMVASADNSMRPVVVTTGRDIGERTEILSGLTAGQRVVASGQFLIDSEANLKAALPKYTDAQAAAAAAPPVSPAGRTPVAPVAGTPVYHGIGVVEKTTPQAITFSHQPIPALQWGAMTMGFEKPGPDAFKDVTVGQQAEFSFKQGRDGYVLESVTPVAGANQ